MRYLALKSELSEGESKVKDLAKYKQSARKEIMVTPGV
jgi:hypothetical protein